MTGLLCLRGIFVFFKIADSVALIFSFPKESRFESVDPPFRTRRQLWGWYVWNWSPITKGWAKFDG